MEPWNRLQAVFREVFDDDTLDISPEMTAHDVDGWDSLSHINLILALEAEFNLKFSQKELLSFKNIGELQVCLSRKLQ